MGETVTADLVEARPRSVPLAGTVAASAPNGYVLDGRLNDSFRAVNLLLDKGVAVRRVGQASADGSVTPGDFLVAGRATSRGDREADRRRLRGARRRRSRPAPTTLRKPRIAMYQRYGGGNMDEGWTRLMFEQFGVPVHVAHGRRDQGRRPRTRSTTSSSCRPIRSPAMTGERPPAGGGGGGGGGGVRRRPRQHAARVSQRLRRRRRQGAAGVRAEGRHAPDLRAGRRPADPALRPAAAQRRRRPAVEGVLVARARRCACSFDNTQSAGLRHAGRRPGAVHGRQPGRTR